MTRDAITGCIDNAIGQNTRNPCFLCPNASAKPAPSADEGWLIASGWFGFDFTIKRPAGSLAALDASSVKPYVARNRRLRLEMANGNNSGRSLLPDVMNDAGDSKCVHMHSL
jgi:hypothetical protein